MLWLKVYANIRKIVVFFLFLLVATSDVKETKDSEKKVDPLKEPPLESDALVRVTVMITIAHVFLVTVACIVGVRLRAICFG